jgi:LPS export ABC transporter protein LptC
LPGRGILCYERAVIFLRRLAPLLACALLGAGCQALAPPGERSAPPDLTFRGVRLEQYARGGLSARSTLRELRYEREPGTAQLDRLEVQLVRAGQPDGTVSAPRATAEVKDARMELRGGVRYASASDERLETASADLDFARHAVAGTEPVTLRGRDFTATAERFTGDTGSPPRFTLAGKVQASFAAPEARAAPPRSLRRPPPAPRVGSK